MPRNFALAEQTLGYVTSQDKSNTDFRYLVGGSKNVLIDFQKKVKIRSGYTRLGAANTALTEVRNAWTWYTSVGTVRPQRFYDDELEAYLDDVENTSLNAWYRVRDGWSTTEYLRSAIWWDTGENLDLQIMVNGNANQYEWNGAVAVALSVTADTITKNGTNTFAQNRFYTTRNKNLINVRTGTVYAYTGGETTTALTGVTPNPTGEILAGDVLIQQVVTQTNEPAASRNNHTIYSFENQLFTGSEDDNEVYVSQNDSYIDTTFYTPRAPGEGALLVLDEPTTAIASIGKLILIFAGRSSVFRAAYEPITVSATPSTAIAETLNVKKLFVGIDQGALNQETVVPLGNSLAFLTNEVALRIIDNPEDLEGLQPRTFSNPIKPDFDAEDWRTTAGVPRAYGFWHKNMLIFTAPRNSRMYILNFVEDADGKLFRFWNPPQVLPVGPMSVIDSGLGNFLSNGEKLHGHSDSVPETYLLFDGASDGQFSTMAAADKLPIDAKAAFAYNNYGKRGLLKNFDEYYVESDLTPNRSEE